MSSVLPEKILYFCSDMEECAKWVSHSGLKVDEIFMDLLGGES